MTRVSARAFGVGLEVTVPRFGRGTRERVGVGRGGGRDDGDAERRGRGEDADGEDVVGERDDEKITDGDEFRTVYVACARRREAVLPVDLSRMAAEGRPPERTKSSRKSAV